MKNDRSIALRERLMSTNRSAEQVDDILAVARGAKPLVHGMPVSVERAVEGIRAPNGESFHVKIAASTEAVARDAGIIPVKAWEGGGLRNFNSNPIILAYHSHRDPIGVSVHTEVNGDNLIQYWKFHEETDLSRTMKVLYEKGYMRAASVGFLVHEYAFIDELDDKEIESLQKKYGTSVVKDAFWIAKSAELLETSAVPVPSDPNALAFHFAARNARAVGMDISPLTQFERNSSMKTDATTTSTTEATAPAAVDAVLTELRSLITDGLAAIRAEIKTANDAFSTRLSSVEQKREETVAAPAAVVPVEERDEVVEQVTIEVNDNETQEDAIARFVDETLARLRGAPAPVKK